MCGIIGAVTHTPVNQLLYDGLLLPQHRGQDAAGIVTSEGPIFHMDKGRVTCATGSRAIC
jgi:amidophosphoribosyltransferase